MEKPGCQDEKRCDICDLSKLQTTTLSQKFGNIRGIGQIFEHEASLITIYYQYTYVDTVITDRKIF
jgi:hypothetical protein